MSASTKKKAKAYGKIAAVALGATFLLNTLASRFQPAAKVRNVIRDGV